MIILNEKEFAEECLKNNEIKEDPYFTLCILAKYYYHHIGYRKKRIVECLTEFLRKNYSRYECNISMWETAIERIASKAGKYKLHEIDGVWITEAELKTISNIHNKVLERLAFTLLCIAKLGNMRNPVNNGWVKNDAKEVFQLARISCSVLERYQKLNKLYQMFLLELPKKNDNLSYRVTFVNNDSKNVIFISDFRELGYEYLLYQGEPYIRCGECGILTKGNKNGTKKYCSSCVGYTPNKTKIVECIDCGEEFEIDGNNKRTKRCAYCQREFIRQYDRNRKKQNNSVF